MLCFGREMKDLQNEAVRESGSSWHQTFISKALAPPQNYDPSHGNLFHSQSSVVLTATQLEDMMKKDKYGFQAVYAQYVLK